MPRARQVSEQERDDSVTVLVPGEGESDAPDASQQWEEFEALRDQGDAGTAGMYVWVYRIPTDAAGNPQSNVETELLFTAPIDVYTLPQLYDRVKREYMPPGMGRELIRMQVRREKMRGVLWQKVVRVAKGSRDDDAGAPSARATEPNVGGIEALARAITGAMQQQNALMLRLFESQRAAPPPDPLAGAEKMVTMITGLAGILVNKTAPAGPATNSLTDMIGAIKQIRELADDMGPTERGDGGERGDSVTGILTAGKPVIELLTALIQRSPAAPAAAPPRRLPPAALRSPTPAPGTVPAQQPLGGTPPIQPTAPTAQGDDPMLLLLSKHVSDICDLIEAGKADAEGIARLVLDAVPEQYDDKFYAIIADEHWLKKLAAVEPRVMNHADFFSHARTFILAEFSDDTQPGAPAS